MTKKKFKARPIRLSDSATKAISIIILKGVAADLRAKFPEMRIEAHPVDELRADLFIARRDIDNSVKINFSRQYRDVDCNYIARKILSVNGCDSKHKNADYLIINIQEPNSINLLENWILISIDELFAEQKTDDSHL